MGQWKGVQSAVPGSPSTSRGVYQTAPEPHSAPPGGSRGPDTVPARLATGPGRRNRGAAPPSHLPRRCRDPCASSVRSPPSGERHRRRGPPGRPRVPVPGAFPILPNRGRPPLTFNRHDVLAMDRTKWIAGAAGRRESRGRAEAANARGGAGPAIAGLRGVEGAAGEARWGGAEEGLRAPPARAAEEMEPSGAAAAAAGT